MDDTLKNYLELKFSHIEDKIDNYRADHQKDIDNLKRQVDDNYGLDRKHRSECSAWRAMQKDEIDKTLSRFGGRIGELEQTFKKAEGSVTIRLENLEKNSDKGKDNLQEWMRVIIPMAITGLILAGSFYAIVKGSL